MTFNEEQSEWAWRTGEKNPERCWLLSGYDVWVKNPHYQGVEQRHPEDDSGLDDTDVMLAINEDEHDVPTVVIPILCEWVELEGDK